MFGKAFQRKYALTEQGVKNIKKGVWWTVVVDLVVMGGISILYLLMRDWMAYWLEDEPMPSFTVYFWMTVFFLVLSLATHYQQYRATYGLVYGEVRNVRIRLAESMRKLPLHFFAKRDLADLSETVMSDVNRLEHVWSHVLGYLYGSFISTTIIAVGLFLQDVHLAIACLWGVPVAFTLLFSSRVLAKRLSEEGKKAALHVSDTMQDMLENVREIRANCQEVSFLQRFFFAVDGQEKIMRKGEFVVGIFVNAASVIMRLGVATTILVGASRIASGKISFMTLFLFMLVISRVYAPFDQSLALIAELFISHISAERLMEIETFDEDLTEQPQTLEEVKSFYEKEMQSLCFQNVSFTYKRRMSDAGQEVPVVLSHVNLEIPKKSCTAFTGPSGCGKSTLLKLMLSLYPLDSGERILRMKDVEDAVLLTASWRRLFAYVPQGNQLMSGTIREILTFRERKEMQEEKRIWQALRIADAEGFVSVLPDGIDTVLGEHGMGLPEGQMQRIAIARAIFAGNPILLLDESTSALDEETERTILKNLQEMTDKTILIVTHRKAVLDICDREICFSEKQVLTKVR